MLLEPGSTASVSGSGSHRLAKRSVRGMVVKLAAGVVLAASVFIGVQSLRLHAEKETEWNARLDSVLNQLHAVLEEQGKNADPQTVPDSRGQAADEALIRRVSDNKKSLDLVLEELRALRGLIEQYESRPGSLGESVVPAYDEVLREDLAVEQEISRASRKQDAIAGFQSQPVDAEWAEKMGSSINDMLTGDDASGVSVPELNCRSSSCEMYWSIDQGLTNLEKFERDNYVLMQMAKLGFRNVVYLDAPNAGEYRAIFSPPAAR